MKSTIESSIDPATETLDSSPVVALDSEEAVSLAAVGGKAANLCKVIRGGLPVPGGFCVTTTAYAQVANAISTDFSQFDSAETEKLKHLAGQIRDAFSLQLRSPRR